jgi:hypothetical protein
MEINLGSVKMPINAATKSFAILAKRGAGKTYLGGVMAEEFFKNGIPFVVFDPIDVWWGLRLTANGKDKGLPVVVFGVRHADIQIDRDMGREIARAVVQEGISCVISTFGMNKTAARHLVAEFAEELLAINTTPRMVFIEEAHEFVPQRVMGGATKVFSAVEALVTMGRNQGIGVTMLNQRAATLNKDVLTQIDTLLALRSVGPQDRKALQDWVEGHGAEGDFDNFLKSLPTLPTGEGWIWSPEFMGVFEKFTIRKRETFHPDREKIGHEFVIPQLDQIDIQTFIDKFSTEVTAAKAKGKPGKSQVVQASVPAQPAPIVDQQAIRELRNEYESQLIEKDTEIRRLSSIIENVRKAVGTSSGTAVVSARASSSAVDLWKSKLGTGLAARIFELFTEHPSTEFTRSQITLGVGCARSGYFDKEMGRLTRNQLLVRNGSQYRLNPNL